MEVLLCILGVGLGVNIGVVEEQTPHTHTSAFPSHSEVIPKYVSFNALGVDRIKRLEQQYECSISEVKKR